MGSTHMHTHTCTHTFTTAVLTAVGLCWTNSSNSATAAYRSPQSLLTRRWSTEDSSPLTEGPRGCTAENDRERNGAHTAAH